MNKILLPVDFPNPSLGVVHQAAFLARHFHSEIILLHVVTPLSYPAGILESGHELTGAGFARAKSSSGLRKNWTNRCGRSSMGLPSNACCSEATRPAKSRGQLATKKWT